ncbi:N-acetylmuramoyl-L-alanine amidase [[Eubacterium] hominis]|uniref:N-acetylmuramoyl-L-alanine amidase n=1 Tax=[Eubacterium] hominis TaxID=2764325 RepID=UPI003A4D6822
MAYAPRKRNYRIKWNIAIPIIFLCVLLIYAGSSIFFKTKEEKETFTVCGFTPEKTASVLNKKSADIVTISDYVYYGESLGLYEKSYSPLNKDTLSGKSVVLHNVCDDSEVTMTLGDTADQKIVLQDIKDGYYEVSIIDNLVKKRVVFSEKPKEHLFSTVARDGMVHDVSIIADADLLADQDITMDHNYMFLNVSSKEPDSDQIDVLIDPYGMNVDIQSIPDKGNEANGLIENDEMYEAAELMKKELESYGLRVEITKSDKDEVIATYGDEGRLAKGYQKHAKYYLFLRFNVDVSTTDTKGMILQHSNYSSPTLARNMMYHMTQADDVVEANALFYNDYSWPGVYSSNLIAGSLDNELIYDVNLNLRESGGRATQAGRYSETSKTENKSFVNADGMQAIEIDFGYITNQSDATNWKQHRKEIVTSCAKAFALGINVINE